MERKVFLISELFYPNKTSTAYIMTEIAKGLSSKSNVTVICADIIYDSNFDANNSDSEISSFDIIRTKRPVGNKNSFSGRIINAVQSSFSFGWSIIKNVKRDDTVFAVTNPFLLVLIVALIRTFKKFNYILLVHDVFPENAIPAGVLKKGSATFSISKKVYDWAYRKADKLIVLGRDMHALVANKIKDSNKVTVIENWFDSDLIIQSSFDRNEYVGRDLIGKIVIGFSGNIGRVQNLATFLKLFKELDNNQLHFVIVGDGAAKDEVLNTISEYDIENVSYLGPKARAEQSSFLNCCDIGLVTLSSGMYGLGVPSKSYNLLALGKPILFIGDIGSEIDLLIKEENVGWSFSWENEQHLKDFLNNLVYINVEVIEKAKELAKERFSQQIIISKINAFLKV